MSNLNNKPYTDFIAHAKSYQERIKAGDRSTIEEMLPIAFVQIANGGGEKMVQELQKKIADGDTALEKEIALMGARSLETLGNELVDMNKENNELFAQVALHSLEVDSLEEATKNIQKSKQEDTDN